MQDEDFIPQDHRSMRQLPKESLPRERLKQYGIQHLTNEELIALLLRTGVKNKNVLELSREFCQKLHYAFHTLTTFEQDAFIETFARNPETRIEGLGENKLILLLAAMEFGRRVYRPTKEEMKSMTKPVLRASEIAHFMFSSVAYNAEENFWVIYLDAKQAIINDKPYKITTGLESHTLIDPKSIFRKACLLRASSLILVHNHPSGDVTPSDADIRTTKHLIKAGLTLGIPVKDHLILGRADIPPHYASLRARELCEF